MVNGRLSSFHATLFMLQYPQLSAYQKMECSYFITV